MADRGPGIDAETVSAISERFGQRDAGAAGGLGIGLWLVRELVGAMGGRLAVQSSDGHGTVFHVDLPAERAVSAGGLAVGADVPL